jgi:serine protease AprX
MSRATRVKSLIGSLPNNLASWNAVVLAAICIRGPTCTISNCVEEFSNRQAGIPTEYGLSRRDPVRTSPGLVADSVISRPVQERMREAGDAEPIGVVIELNAGHPDGVRGAAERVESLVALVSGDQRVQIVGGYLAAALTAGQIDGLVREDTCADPHAPIPGASVPGAPSRAPRCAIHRIWPNFAVHALITRSIVTTKVAAAHRAFNALGQDVVWAVLDSGVDAAHPHFQRHRNLQLDGGLRHRNFVGDGEPATVDHAGHGTHVAAILAGEQVAAPGAAPLVAATWYEDNNGNMQVTRRELDTVSGMAPRCKLLSCKVLRDDGSGDMIALLAALHYIQELNDYGRELRIHGVNLSVGYPFDPSWFAAGCTPVCREVDRLVRSGVVVVAAAGNTGYGYALGPDEKRVRLGFDLTINDPGNAERAITVGSTSTSPHATGVSYFSSKGPTGDGRLKPDLVAPGERVVSAGAGTLLATARRDVPDASYVENSGTSMAAPHVSGLAAAFLSVHREYIGRPEEVKRVLLESATDLGRAREFQGYGLVDAMRAIQAV